MKAQNPDSDTEEIIAYIQFYGEIKKVKLPQTFEGLQEKISKMLQINSEVISSLIISYKDEDNDSVMVNSNEDYLILLDQIKSKQVNIIIVEKGDKANIDVNTCSQSLIKFKEKIDNNDEANKKNLDIVSNQQFEINKQEKKEEPNNKKIKINNININNNIKDIKDEIEINNNNINDKNEFNNIDNDLNYSNSEDDIISPYIQKEQNNNLNHNNINIVNQVNNINYNNNINQNANVNLSQTYLVFPLACGLCSQYPIVKILYYCPACSIYICSECEKKPDINHRHSILKIQTSQQYADLNEKINKSNDELNLEKNMNQSNFQRIKNDIKNSVIKIFAGNEEEVKEPQKNLTQQMSLIQIARTQYGLQGISDNQLEEAIRKTNGDIEKAIPLLFK